MRMRIAADVGGTFTGSIGYDQRFAGCPCFDGDVTERLVARRENHDIARSKQGCTVGSPTQKLSSLDDPEF